MALDLGGSSTNAGDFSGALITGIVVSIVLVALIGGLIILAALYWRNLARKMAPNKFQTPQSEKAWPKPPTKPADLDEYSTDSSTTPSRASSIRKPDPVVHKQINQLPKSVTIPSMVFENSSRENRVSTKHIQ